MELGGDEKRIQALFSELSFADQSVAPRFKKLWRAAETTTPTRVVRFNKPVAVIVSAFLVAAACSLAIWSWSKSIPSLTETTSNVVSQTISIPVVTEQNKLLSASGPTHSRQQRRRRLARRLPAERAIAREAALLSSWQSPTAGFMSSPTASVLNSLPQLTQSVNELKQFLSKNNEVTKESNQ